MALKDRWSRMLRKSVSSTSSGGQNDTAGSSNDEGDLHQSVTAPTTASSPKRSTGRLAKTWSWRSAVAGTTSAGDTGSSGAPVAATPKPPKKQSKQRVHPSERPLTETNLRHQEMLSTFTMSFGRRARRPSQGGRSSFSGISPGNSRRGSMDSGYAHAHPPHLHSYSHGHGHGHGGERTSMQLPDMGMASVEEDARRE